MIRRISEWTLLLFAVGFSFASAVEAQVISTSPYDPLAREKSKWPPFYRPDPSDAKYTQMLAEGWCKPTGWRAQQYYLSKLVDVNALPESALNGKISEITPGQIKVVDEQGRISVLIAHPDRSISYVQVQGKAARTALQVGEYVRFVGRSDPAGRVREPVTKLELISPTKGEMVLASRQQNIIGKIARVDGSQLTVLAQSTRVQRLTIELADAAAVTVNFADLNHVAVGDAVKAKGRRYDGGVGIGSFYFAEELEVTLGNEIKSMPKLTAAK